MILDNFLVNKIQFHLPESLRAVTFALHVFDSRLLMYLSSARCEVGFMLRKSAARADFSRMNLSRYTLMFSIVSIVSYHG